MDYLTLARAIKAKGGRYARWVPFGLRFSGFTGSVYIGEWQEYYE